MLTERLASYFFYYVTRYIPIRFAEQRLFRYLCLENTIHTKYLAYEKEVIFSADTCSDGGGTNDNGDREQLSRCGGRTTG